VDVLGGLPATELCRQNIARASDSMFLCIDFVRVTNCFYDYDYEISRDLTTQIGKMATRIDRRFLATSDPLVNVNNL